MISAFPGLVGSLALALALSAGAQTPSTPPTPAPGTPPSNPSPAAAPQTPPPAAPPPAAPPPGTTPPGTTTPKSEPTVAPATPAAANPPASGVDQIIKDLESKGSTRPSVRAATPAPAAPSANLPGTPGRPDDRERLVTAEQRAIASGKLLREGSFIVSRRARMVRVREGGGWALVFDNTPSASPASSAPATPAAAASVSAAASPQPADMPIILQPCQKLAEMERFALQYGDAITFTVSGQVFVYKGRNYLLPSIAIPDRTDSNLGR